VKTPASRLTLQTYHGRAGLSDISAQWARVLSGIAHPEFFQRYEWYEALLDAWPSVASQTFFEVAYRDGEVIGICPLQLTSARVQGIPVRTFSPPDPNDVAYPDLICSAADRRELFEALLAHLRNRRDPSWDLLSLPKCFSDESAIAALTAGGSVFAHTRGVCYYFPTDQGLEAINARVSSGLRKHLRWCRRQLNAAGTVEFVVSRSPQSLPDLLQQFLALEASGWKGAHGEGTAISLDQALVQFYTDLLHRFGASGECEINLLRLNGHNIAGQFCLVSGGTWNHLKIAYDEEFDKYSPGAVLLEEVFGRLCADERVHTANFLTGADWAKRWHAWEQGVYRIVAANHTVAGYLALQQIRMRRLVRDRVLPLVTQSAAGKLLARIRK
jgi:CelD/BcsL family acetyltransferase involved in cellulose biosynthesis